MKTYTLKNPKALGEHDPKYGTAYWSYTHDSDMPVMFNLMDGQVGEGSVITADTVELAQSKKGTEYHRLRKVKVQNQSAITSHESTNEELILQKLDKILKLLEPSGYEKAKATRENLPKPELDNVIEDIGDEPIDLSSIPF